MRRADERHGAALLAFFVAALLGAAVLVAALTSCARDCSFACGVGASCADGVPYRSVDGGGVVAR